jgi:hypothetical protein
MEACYTKTTRQDPNSQSGVYADYTLSRNAVYCCEKFKLYCKKFPSWSYEIGRFTIVDSITYEGSEQTPIDYCPFCGKRIKYIHLKDTRTKR